MHRLANFLTGALIGGIVLVACAGNKVTEPNDNALPPCTGKAVLSKSPIELDNVVGWVPLGNLNPPGHTLPTNHQYLYHTNPNGGTPHSVTVFSPANIVIQRANKTSYSTTGSTDYSLTFQICREVFGQLAHIASLDAGLASQIGPIEQRCNSYSPSPGLTVTTCESNNISVQFGVAGVIGTAGGTPGLYGLDFTLWDTRQEQVTFANPERWARSSNNLDDYHIVPASDYFFELLKSQVAAKLGSGDGTQQRGGVSPGGTIGVDVVGTAQGYWFKDSEPRFPESPHLAFAPDNVDPGRIALSVGTSQTGLASGVYRYFPTSINRAASTMVADGTVHCVEFSGNRTILFQLTDATTLRIEARPSGATCASSLPWTFTASAVEYRR